MCFAQGPPARRWKSEVLGSGRLIPELLFAGNFFFLSSFLYDRFSGGFYLLTCSVNLQQGTIECSILQTHGL